MWLSAEIKRQLDRGAQQHGYSLLASARKHFLLTVCLVQPKKPRSTFTGGNPVEDTVLAKSCSKNLIQKSEWLSPRCYITLFPLAHTQQQVVACLLGIDMLPLAFLLRVLLCLSPGHRYPDPCRLVRERHTSYPDHVQIAFLGSITSRTAVIAPFGMSALVAIGSSFHSSL